MTNIKTYFSKERLPMTLIILGVALNVLDMLMGGRVYGPGSPLEGIDKSVGLISIPGTPIGDPTTDESKKFGLHVGGELALVGAALWAYRKWV